MDREAKAKKYGIEIVSDEESEQIYFDKVQNTISIMSGDLPIDRLRNLILRLSSAADARERDEAQNTAP